jgi:hypothetical protein
VYFVAPIWAKQEACSPSKTGRSAVAASTDRRGQAGIAMAARCLLLQTKARPRAQKSAGKNVGTIFAYYEYYEIVNSLPKKT